MDFVGAASLADDPPDWRHEMKGDNPYPAPAPRTLAMMLSVHAWRDDIDDDSRKLSEWSAEVIESLLDRLVRQAKLLEDLEAARQ